MPCRLFINVIPEDDNEEEYRRIIGDNLTALYGYKKSPQELAFNKELLWRGRPSMRTYTYFFMVLWSAFIFNSVDYLLYCYQTTVRRCVIPELQGYNFDNEDINVLGGNSRYSSNCDYVKRNYTELLIVSNYSMSRMLMIVKKDKNKTSRIRCDKFVSYRLVAGEPETQEHVSLYDYYSLHCASKEMISYLTHGELLGTLIFTPVCYVLADMYGRKFMFVVAYGITFVAVIFLYIPNLYVLMVMKVCTSMTSSLALLLLIIFLEDCSVYSRHIFGFIVLVSEPVSTILIHMMLLKTRVYLIRLTISILLLLSQLFIVWHYRESARWTFYMGWRQQAWKALTVRTKYPVNLRDMSNKRKADPRKQLSLFFKFIYRMRTFRHCALMFGEMFLVTNRQSILYMVHTEAMWMSYFTVKTMTAVCMVVAHVALIVVGRRTVLLSAHVILIVAIASSALQVEWEGLRWACVCTQQSLCDVCYYLLLYHGMELYPTPQRATIVGLSVFCSRCARICNVYVNGYLTAEKQAAIYTVAMFAIAVCTVTVAFVPETFNYDLPDLPREPLSARFVNVC